jgi:folate-binding protein YgfZ
MSIPQSVDLSSGPRGLGVLAFRGPDAASFLQGQLSANVVELVPGMSQLTGFHNAQGRAIALLTLARLSPEDIFAVLPRELAAAVATRLRKFVFRAKVTIEESPLRPLGAAAGADPSGAYAFRWGNRQLLLAPEGRGPATGADSAAWELDDLRQGMPQVYAATSEAFVAQMLNLDLLGGISWDKGCYTGQEVIARAHYRGKVKRRMQRWLGRGAIPSPGDTVHAANGRALTVVRAAAADDGFELLAVGTFGAMEDAAGAASPAGGVTAEGPLPLPYSLPD